MNNHYVQRTARTMPLLTQTDVKGSMLASKEEKEETHESEDRNQKRNRCGFS